MNYCVTLRSRWHGCFACWLYRYWIAFMLAILLGGLWRVGS